MDVSCISLIPSGVSFASFLHQRLGLLLFLHSLFNASGILNGHTHEGKNTKAAWLWLQSKIWTCVWFCGHRHYGARTPPIWKVKNYETMWKTLHIWKRNLNRHTKNAETYPNIPRLYIPKPTKHDRGLSQVARGCNLGVCQGRNQLLIVQNVALGIRQKLQDFVLAHGDGRT